MTVLLLVLTALLTIVAGVLASVDAAISAFSRARAEELHDEGRAGASRLGVILEDPAPFINSVLLMRIVSETAAVVLFAVVVIDTADAGWPRMLIAIGAMSVVSFVAIGVGPRTLGRQHAERFALLSSLPVVVLTRVLGPVSRILIAVGNSLTPGRGFKEGPFASEVEVRELVDLAAASSLIESDESKMIQSVFELGDTIVREVMVPRTDLVYVEQAKTLRQAMSLALRSGYSRIPVVEDNLDDVVGMAYLKDITKRVFDNHVSETTEKVESVARPCLFVPDTKHADQLLREMQASRTHVAIVVDEYGGTSGMVTIEDILEEIVGEITDEYDLEPDESEQLSDGTWRLSARFEVDDLEELFDIPIDDDDVDTVGGLLAKHLGKVPIPGSTVDVEGLRFVAESPSGRRNRIGRVLVTRLDDSSDHDSAVASSHGTGS